MMSLSSLPCVLSFFLISLLLLPAASSLQCDKADKITLLKFKKSFGNPPSLASWNPATDCCNWKGVSCEMFTGQTLGLTFADSNLSGPIPPSIGDFPVLSYIDFHNLPYLTGPIPPSITKLTLLKDFTITHTGLSGPIPSFIGNLTQLLSVNMSSNRLTGPIPDTFGDTFDELDFSNNQLTGPVPASLFRGSISTPKIHLSHNQLSGQIPRALGKISFWVVDLSHNRLTGDASFLFGATQRLLQEIDLSSNEFDFDMGTVLRFPLELTSVDLSHNKIRGGISRQITMATRLMRLDLSHNRLCGRIPTGGKMSRFGRDSYIYNKCLCGTPLPRCH